MNFQRAALRNESLARLMVEVMEKCIRGTWIDLHNVTVDDILINGLFLTAVVFKHLISRR